MLTKEYVQSVYDYLNDKWSQYYIQPRERNRIEDAVRQYSHNLSDELYLLLNENRATGLFEHGFFETDMQRSFEVIAELLRTNIYDEE